MPLGRANPRRIWFYELSQFFFHQESSQNSSAADLITSSLSLSVNNPSKNSALFYYIIRFFLKTFSNSRRFIISNLNVIGSSLEEFVLKCKNFIKHFFQF